MTYCSVLENNVCPREKVWPIGFYPKSTFTHNVLLLLLVCKISRQMKQINARDYNKKTS